MIRRLIHIVFLIFIFSVQNLFAQEIREVNGKKYRVHKVERGQTIYGIARKYELKQKDISDANPGILETGLKPGQEVLVPLPKDAITQTPQESKVLPQNVTTYTVQKGETLYGISKKTGVSIDELQRLNPDVAAGLKEGQVLVLSTSSKVNGTDSVKENEIAAPRDLPEHDSPRAIVEHKVKKGETLFGISKKYRTTEDSIRLYTPELGESIKIGQNLIVPLDRSWADSLKLTWYPDFKSISDRKAELLSAEKKSVYEVGVIMPFFLDRNKEWLEGTIQGVDIYEATRQSMDFYHGVKLAADSLKKAGLSVNFHLFDSRLDSASLAKIVSSDDFKKLDLVIGPSTQVEIVSSAANSMGIPLICPFSYTNRILLDQPNVVKMVTSTSVVIEKASDFIVSKYGEQNLILINGIGKKDDKMVDYYKKLINDRLSEKGIRDSVIEVKAEGYSSKAFVDKLQKDKINVLIIPSEENSYVSSILTTLNNISIKHQYKDHKFLVMGTDDWLKFDDVDDYYKVKFNVHIPSTSYISFTDTASSVPFIRYFRMNFGTDPDKYAMMGFDIGYYFLAGYKEWGKSFIYHLEEYQMEGVNTLYRFRRLNQESGYLNTGVYILRYADYSLVKEDF